MGLAGALIAAASPAAADRHCYPASELYFMARQALLDEDAAPPRALADALAHLQAAEAEAAICSCTEMIAVLAALRLLAQDSADAAETILDARETVEAAVKACHG